MRPAVRPQPSPPSTFRWPQSNTGLACPHQVGAKLDKAGTGRAVPQEEGQALAEAHGARFCEASAKTRDNVRRPFVEIVDQIVQSPALLAAAGSGRTAGTVAVQGAGRPGLFSACSC